jgi:hypothetical protein
MSTIVSCSKDDDDDSNSTTPSAKYYFNGTLGSQSFKLEFTSTGNVTPGTSISSTLGIDTSEASWGGFLYASDSVGDITESWGVDFQTLVSTDGDFSEADFNSLFNTGDYPFVLIDELGPNGVLVKGDVDSVFYTSVPPPGQSQPSSSKMNVSSVTKKPAEGLASAYVEVKGTVKATVWIINDLGNYTGGSTSLDASFSLLITKD